MQEFRSGTEPGTAGLEIPAWRNSRGAPPSHQNLPGLKRSRSEKFNLNLSLLKQKFNSPAVGAGSPLDPPREISPKFSAPTTPKGNNRTSASKIHRFYLKTPKIHQSKGKQPGKPWVLVLRSQQGPVKTSTAQGAPSAALLSQCPSESTAFTQKGLQENESFPGTSNKSPLQSLS